MRHALPTVGCRDTWSRSAERGRRESDQSRLANSRGHEATELPIRRARSGANPAVGGANCLIHDRDASSCNLKSRVGGARLNPSADLALQECTVVSLFEPTVGRARLNPSGQVRAGDKTHQCSEEEPLAETANHRH